MLYLMLARTAPARLGESQMVALIVLLLILALFGGLGFAVHFLWIVLVIAVLLWLIGFFIGGAERGLGGGRRRWYGRW
jgi:energy-coupling factor transporter transmembrane protein EcfT